MDNETTKAVQEGDLFLLTGEEMRLLLPWLRDTLTAQEKRDENSDLCQLTSRILRLSSRLYGTASESRETCICRG
ncbi:hypothetical protein E0L36_22035 [Streptomyces sp. AJS327]|uniref:hypothetical protein n=1 Tax=Streptomyces sp. AJS327 TaxID=2545265 RepID=UPI0015DE68FA|nr:hypothetical protein [Streptomyces sp. AJS327]MBA0053457.1 hypothetical protein [Streptomyces sp. AJS327]